MARKCPNCGELVPDFSVTCPKCFKEVPRKEEKPKEVPKERAPALQTINKWIVIILAFVPSLFGFMGLAQMYQRKFKRGLFFLITGLILFAVLVSSVFYLVRSDNPFLVIVGIVIVIVFGLMFVATYIIQALDAFARLVFRVL